MEHAVVVGGSMAGLLAARALSGYFQRVTLIERDKLPAKVDHRRGVPQSRHTHGLLVSGRDTLERYFPGLSRDLTADGAIPGDILQSVRWFIEGGCHARAVSGLAGLMMSRPLLEAHVRTRVLGLPNVACRDETMVDGLAMEPLSGRVTGVHIGSETLRADLTVDATGRGSRTLQWLERKGFETPPEERVEIGLAYTTRLFRRARTDLNGDLGAVLPPSPEGKRGGVMLAQEGGLWTVTLIAHFSPPAPTGLNGFTEYARHLPCSDIYEVIRSAEPVGEGMSARFPASVRRRFEKISRFPGGLLVLGDAIASFNPIYGQGMSAACLQALALEESLREGEADLARRFFLRAARVVDTPWSIAAGNDLRMPEAVGRRPASVRLTNWYMAQLHRSAHSDPATAIAFHRVGNLLDSPASLMRPRIAVRVLSGMLPLPWVDTGRPHAMAAGR